MDNRTLDFKKYLMEKNFKLDFRFIDIKVFLLRRNKLITWPPRKQKKDVLEIFNFTEQRNYYSIEPIVPVCYSIFHSPHWPSNRRICYINEISFENLSFYWSTILWLQDENSKKNISDEIVFNIVVSSDISIVVMEIRHDIILKFDVKSYLFFFLWRLCRPGYTH